MPTILKTDFPALCQGADDCALDLAKSIFEIFDNPTELDYFVDMMFYIHHLTDSDQFYWFLNIIYEIVDSDPQGSLTISLGNP